MKTSRKKAKVNAALPVSDLHALHSTMIPMGLAIDDFKPTGHTDIPINQQAAFHDTRSLESDKWLFIMSDKEGAQR